jgi:hypothetical protein
MRNAIFILFLLPLGLMAQADLKPIASALQTGNVSALAAYFDRQVEITLLSQDDFYDKASATAQMQTFFAGNRPSACSLSHKSTSDDKTSGYAVGTLTAGGKNYRVSVYTRTVDGKALIRELRIEL